MAQRGTAVKQRIGANNLPKFISSLPLADKARLSSWTDFLQGKGIEVEDANGRHFDLWIDQLRLSGVSPGIIDDHRRVVRNFYAFLRRRGVAVSLSMWNATNTPPTPGSSNGASAEAPSSVATPRLQLVGGTSTAPANGPKASRATPSARDQELLRRFLDTIKVPGTRDNHRAALEQWSRFLAERGRSLEDPGPWSLRSWKAHLQKKGRKPGTIAVYSRHVDAFNLWRKGGAAVAAKPRRLSTAKSAAPARDRKLPASYRKQLDWFLATIDTPSTRGNYQSVLEQWLAFLVGKKISIEHAGTRARSSWRAELRRRGKKKQTIDRYVQQVGSFEDWRRHGVTIATRKRRPSADSPQEIGLLSPRDTRRLVERFLGTIPNLSTRQGHRAALGQWSKFLAERGETIEHPGPESLESWKAELLSRGKKSKTVYHYTRYVAVFYDWLHEDDTITTVVPGPLSSDGQLEPPKQPGRSSTGGTPDARDRALREAFLGTITSPSKAEHYKSALSRWSRFLDDRHAGASTAQERGRLIEAWAGDMRGMGFTSDTVTRYTTAVAAFYSWAEEAAASLPAVLPEPPRVGPVLPEPAPLETAPLGTDGEVEAPSVATSEPPASFVSPEALDSLIAKVDVLTTASNAHERRLAALDAKLAALPVAPAQEPASRRDLEELASRQSRLEAQWEAANTRLADQAQQLSVLIDHERAGRTEQLAWAKEMGEIARQVKATLYQSADAATKEVLTSQPQAGSSCVEEMELLIDGCFRGLETSNADIIDGAAKLDKAPQGRAWADKLHKALLALDSYAQSNFAGDFKSFCEAMPPGHNVVPVTWVARHEPAATVNGGRSREERTFPVPSAVAQSGRLFMPEHISLGNGGIGPRLHYYDDRKGRTHKVHIGYVGPHLLSRDTA